VSGGKPLSRDPGSLSRDPGPTRVFTRWGEDDRGPRVPWIGIFLVIFGGLILLERVLPDYRNLGNVLVLAAGLAFLVAWALRRGPLPFTPAPS
jgi:hypothetical protein